jgi:hypothetical protein
MHEPENEPLLPQDREDLLDDLEDLEVFQTLLEARGVHGLLVDCAECEAPHYFEWELLRANLRHLLDVGVSRAHEPAFDPDPAEYVTWDYAMGFAAGVLSASEAMTDDIVEASQQPPKQGPTIDLR